MPLHPAPTLLSWNRGMELSVERIWILEGLQKLVNVVKVSIESQREDRQLFSVQRREHRLDGQDSSFMKTSASTSTSRTRPMQ